MQKSTDNSTGHDMPNDVASANAVMGVIAMLTLLGGAAIFGIAALTGAFAG